MRVLVDDVGDVVLAPVRSALAGALLAGARAVTLVAEGEVIIDPREFTQRLTDVMQKALGK